MIKACNFIYFQHTLAKLYIEILGLGKDSPNSQKLLNYRAPKSAKGVSNKQYHCSLPRKKVYTLF